MSSREAALDLMPSVRVLLRVAGCAPSGEIPARFSAATVDAHCKALLAFHEQWRKRWLALARPFFDQVVPADVPARVVYPFGGGDLLTALVTFPAALEITTLSLEPAGDPRAIETLPPSELAVNLTAVRKNVNHIFAIGHSKTTDMGKMAKSKLPGDLTYALVALTLNDFDVLAVRVFRLGPSGEVVYLSQADIDMDAGKTTGRRSPFGSVEIEYRSRAGGPVRTFRHLAVNLNDRTLTADPSVLRHLEAKGRIAAMTKAASYLLWWDQFGKIRDYLLRNMVWMVSDSTGIPFQVARAAGFEQIPFGRFEGPFLGGGREPTEDFKKLWADEAAPLAFRFGYPDRAGNDHLLITRRAVEK
ncbi:MAG: hypothetical protein ABUL67_03970 [Haliangium ochraceum]